LQETSKFIICVARIEKKAIGKLGDHLSAEDR